MTPAGVSPRQLARLYESRHGNRERFGLREAFFRSWLTDLEMQGLLTRVAADRWAINPEARGWWRSVDFGLSAVFGEIEGAA